MRGGFDSSEAFVGSMAGLAIWDRALVPWGGGKTSHWEGGPGGRHPDAGRCPVGRRIRAEGELQLLGALSLRPHALGPPGATLTPAHPVKGPILDWGGDRAT